MIYEIFPLMSRISLITVLFRISAQALNHSRVTFGAAPPALDDDFQLWIMRSPRRKGPPFVFPRKKRPSFLRPRGSIQESISGCVS